MILPRRALPPLVLLVAVLTLTSGYYAGLAAAPRAFLGSEDLLLLLPRGSVVPGQGELDGALLSALQDHPAVLAASGEIFAPTVVQGHSVLVRGVDVDAFLPLDGASLLRGRPPASPTEIMLGEELAQTLDKDVGDRILLAGAKATILVDAAVVGVFASRSASSDEAVATLALARDLAGLPPGALHLVRVAPESRRDVLSLLDATTPVFTYSDVRLSTEAPLPGEIVALRGNLTNWGRIEGTKEVRVVGNGRVLTTVAIEVGPLQTVAIEVPFAVPPEGLALVQVNPTIPLQTRAPSLQIVGAPRAAPAGTSFDVQVTRMDGTAPPPGTRLEAGGASVPVDGEGRASVMGERPGNLQLRAIVNGTSEAVHNVWITRPGDEDEPVAHVLALSSPTPFQRANESAAVIARVRNVGGTEGLVEVRLQLANGTPVRGAAILAPGEEELLRIDLGPLPAGSHTVREPVSNRTHTLRVVAEDPRVAELLASYRSRANATAAPTLGENAQDYVERLLGDVTIAIVAVSVVSAGLSAMAAVAVLARHLAERRRTLGVLKAIGADDGHVLQRASMEALVAAAIVIPLGILAGWLASLALDATGWVRAFGHTVHPHFPWFTLLLLGVGTAAFLLVATRALVGRALLAPADALLRDDASLRGRGSP